MLYNQINTFINPSSKWAEVSETFTKNLTPLLASLKTSQDKDEVELEETLKTMLSTLISDFISFREI